MSKIHALIAQHVREDAGPLVKLLKSGAHWFDPSRARHSRDGADLRDAAQDALDLSAPVLDYESAAREAGWEDAGDGIKYRKPKDSEPQHEGFTFNGDGPFIQGRSWQNACEGDGIEPHVRNVFAFHIVTPWLAERLEAKGERIARDFAGLIVWARAEIAPDYEAAARVAGYLIIEQPHVLAEMPPTGFWWTKDTEEENAPQDGPFDSALEAAKNCCEARMIPPVTRPALADDPILAEIAAELPPSLWYVAKYGDSTGGLDVEFYSTEAAMDAAVTEAEDEHDSGETDSYIHGEVY